ncbi:LAME_0E04610g1_1 [Lachancea meyersii CBS 8951]|uniref:Peptide chain release factor 1, mitochondrial n=1 Tax=Lachancea meyersii CBS 8951 TaxID=1266667 RepID=A0A1G4JH48_9SACH|nr:LAME_0E04610g1_1 [Lachancea meyersii CBS 8951]
MLLSRLQTNLVGSLRARRLLLPKTCLRFQTTAGSDELHELHPLLLERAKKYAEELESLEQKMAQGTMNFDVEREKHFSRLSAVVDSFRRYSSEISTFRELQAMVDEDPTLREEAEQEIQDIKPNLVKTSSALLAQLLPPHPFADRPCILEIRPGVGGLEAMIFAQDLLTMYINYAQNKRWKHHLISHNENESGSGIVDAILSIDEPGAYDILRFEAGVHRVQRIPATETKGRTHTSTAAVIVLPQMAEDTEKEADSYERSFKPDEIRIDVMRARGKGGQHVNTTDSAVRLTHYPSGIVINMQNERSQHKNKAKAFAILRARLAEMEQKEKEQKARDVRKGQVSTIDRSDKVRTYNFPQNRVTDHRCGFNLHDMEGIMAGERLDDVVEAMRIFDSDMRAKELLKEVESHS